jgi:hypothetical protein
LRQGNTVLQFISDEKKENESIYLWNSAECGLVSRKRQKLMQRKDGLAQPGQI